VAVWWLLTFDGDGRLGPPTAVPLAVTLPVVSVNVPIAVAVTMTADRQVLQCVARVSSIELNKRVPCAPHLRSLVRGLQAR
jgi:hypothetical protein